MPFSRNALPDLSSGPDNEKKKETPRAFWQASACSVRVMRAVCGESLWAKKLGGDREREREYLSVVKQGGSIVPELIRAWQEKRKREREGGGEKRIIVVKRARRRE